MNISLIIKTTVSLEDVTACFVLDNIENNEIKTLAKEISWEILLKDTGSSVVERGLSEVGGALAMIDEDGLQKEFKDIFTIFISRFS